VGHDQPKALPCLKGSFGREERAPVDDFSEFSNLFSCPPIANASFDSMALGRVEGFGGVTVRR
jgi:hypothetical protein